jgi:hypothetical protein
VAAGSLSAARAAGIPQKANAKARPAIQAFGDLMNMTQLLGPLGVAAG